MFFDNDMEVIYVGYSGKIGRRLGGHFKGVDNLAAEVNGFFRKRPKYILAIASVGDNPFDHKAVERYLIMNLDTIENDQGRHQPG